MIPTSSRLFRSVLPPAQPLQAKQSDATTQSDDKNWKEFGLAIKERSEGRLSCVQEARLCRDLITLLTSPVCSVELRTQLAELILREQNVSDQSIRNVLAHSLEIAILENDAELVSGLRALQLRGISAQTTFMKEPKENASGADGVCKLISEFLVSKTFCEFGRAHFYFGASGDPKSDFVKNHFLFQSGVSVPRPVLPRVAKVPKSELDGELKASGVTNCIGNSLVMERIKGGPHGLLERLLDKVFEPLPILGIPTIFGMLCTVRSIGQIVQTTKATIIGMRPSDIHRGNSIFSQDLRKVFLVDFSRWEFRNKLRGLYNVDPFTRSKRQMLSLSNTDPISESPQKGAVPAYSLFNDTPQYPAKLPS